jgi:predicted helicase
MEEYIYLRTNETYETHELYKLGYTSSIPDRDNQYKTGEVHKGKFILVIQIKNARLIEELLKKYFKPLNVKYNGGTEFFKKEIINLIIPFLIKYTKFFKVLTDLEISNLLRKNRVKEILNKISKVNLVQRLNNIILPNKQQYEVLNSIDTFYQENNIGKIIWACGLGKALLGIFIIQKLEYKKIVIGVPTKYLRKQMKKEIIKLFPNEENILYVGSTDNNEDDDTIESKINTTTDIKMIRNFINKQSNKPLFIITTYHSCHLLIDDQISFDFKIGDEAHHLVGNGTIQDKSYKEFHKIISEKTLFMTATEKVSDEFYSMNNEQVFGKCISEISIYWAIDNYKITDYNLLVIKNTENEVNDIIKNINLKVEHKDLFMSAYMTLKAIEHYPDLTHVVIYANSTKNADIINDYVSKILDKNILTINKDNFYKNSLHSGSNLNFFTEINKFKESIYGIISCVYIFGEGFDLPKLNGVCFAENMESDIRIVQCALRANRIEKTNPNKKAYIIIPYIDSNTEQKSFEKCKKIIYKMRNYEERIEQKINVLTSNTTTKNSNTNNNNVNVDFEENKEILNQLKLRLRYSKTLYSGLTEEQDEYNYIRELNKELNLQSKEEYVIFKDKHKNYIDNPEEYFKLKGVWTNWYNFLGVDTTKFIQSKDTWKHFCLEQNVSSLEEYNKLCKVYEQLPRNPGDFYSNFTNILSELDLFEHLF